MVDSEEDKIEPIVIENRESHIGEVISAAMFAVHLQETKFSTCLLVCYSPLESTCKGRDCEGAFDMKNPLLWW